MILWTLGTLAFVTWYAMRSIEKTMDARYQLDLLASPFGYTRSLALVIVPIVPLLYWYVRYPNDHRRHWRGFLRAVGVLVILWFLLDILLAPTIFQFPNCKATLEIYLPGWIPGQGFQGLIPVEEFLFYAFAVLLILLIYIAASEIWFPNTALRGDAYDTEATQAIPIVVIHRRAIGWGVLLIVLAVVFKYFVAPAAPPPIVMHPLCELPAAPVHSGIGFPIYAVFLVLVLVVPNLLIYEKLLPFINTSALQLTVFITTLISLIWEVTLALPYGWWTYDHHWMVGIRVPAWFSLPVESAILWIASGWGVVFMYELFRLHCATGQTLLRVLFYGSLTPPRGPPPGPAPRPPAEPLPIPSLRSPPPKSR